jgi:hypothetical protein
MTGVLPQSAIADSGHGYGYGQSSGLEAQWKKLAGHWGPSFVDLCAAGLNASSGCFRMNGFVRLNYPP